MAKRWTKEEDQIIIENFPIMGLEVYKLLSDRTPSSVTTHIKKNYKEFTKAMYPKNLFYSVFGTGSELPIEGSIEQNMEKAINYLKEMYPVCADAIVLHFKEAMTLEEIANVNNITKERVWQIINKGIRTLRRHDYTTVIFFGLDIFLLNSKQETNMFNSLNFSVRAHNTLKRANVNTIEQLTSMTTEDLMKIRNMNKSTIDEIEELLDGVGLKLADK